MNLLDEKEEYGKYFLDPSRKIPKAHMETVCLSSRTKEACRYAALLSFGFVCMKKSPLKSILDNLVEENKIVRRGDNCEGLGVLGASNG